MTSSANSATSERGERLDPSLALAKIWSGSILDRLRDHVVGQGGAVSAGVREGQLDFRQLEVASDRVAKAMVERSARPGEVVSIFGDRSPRLTVALLAIMKAGCAFQIIDPRYPVQRILECLNYVQSIGIVNASQDAEAASRLLAQSRLPADRFCLSVADALQPGDAGLPDHAPSRGSAPITMDTPMYVAFTSGTSGVPKAVWGSHGPISHFFEWQQKKFDIQPEDRVSVLSGLAHDPILRDVLMPVWAGCSSWFPPDDVYLTPGSLYAWIRDTKISIIHVTASLCHLLLNIPKSQASAQLDSLRLAFFGGERLNASMAARFSRLAPSCQIVNCYGATETPQVMGFHVLAPGESREAGVAGSTIPIGRGIDGVQLVVLDDQRRLCPAGVVGEIFIRTPYRALRIEDIRGQASNSLIANPFTADPNDLLYRTGDYGQYLPDGTVSFIGRRDRQVKIRGYRVDLSEIERFVGELKDVSHYHLDAASDGSDVRLDLFVAPAEGRNLVPEQLREALSRQLPGYMIPERIAVLPVLPRTPNGKVDAQRLRELHAGVATSAPGRDGTRPGSASDVPARVTALLSPLTDGNTELGYVDSIKVVELACLLEDEVGVKIPAEVMQQFRTVPDIVQYIERALKRGASFGDDADAHGIRPMEEQGRRASAAELFRGSFSDRPKGLRWLPRDERVGKAVANRILQILARVAPETLRLRFHRWRGVELGQDVSIGYDSIIETAFPWLVRIGNHVSLGMRVTIIGHFRGMELLSSRGQTVIIEDSAFIGPGSIILPNVIIGEGAVVAAGSVVSANVPPFTFVQGNPARVVARCGLPLSSRTSYSDFLDHLIPISSTRSHRSDPADVIPNPPTNP